jgi:type I restriction enzyme S subunit
MLFDSPPDNWQISTLGVICQECGGDIQTGPFGSQLHASDYVLSGIPSIMPANIKGGRVSEEGIARISEADAKRLSKYLTKAGDIVYSRRGDVERCALIRKREEGWLCGTGCLRVRTGSGVVDPDFCSHFLSHPETKEWISRHAVGATMPNLNTQILSALPVLLPSLQEQKAIAHILGTLDDKIELNRKTTNETLEAMAKALFKSWFVDFDPVRAKAEGRPTGLPPEISDLFPDSFEDSELGEIPSGWEMETLGEVIELAYGKPLKEEQRNGGSYPVFGSNGVVGSHDEYLVEAPGIVVGRKGNPGTVEWSEKNFYPIDTTFFVVNKKGGLGLRFLFYCLKNQNLSDLSADSAVPGLNRNHAYMNNQLLPPVEVASAFERHLEVIFKRKAFLAEEINTLDATRDALLPKLISGELRIPDAEKLLESVL